MDTLTLHGVPYRISRATLEDVPAIVALLADDPLGSARETAPAEDYRAAFERIEKNPADLLVVVRDAEHRIVATLQLTLLEGLSRGGATRLQIEGVRVTGEISGRGLGTALLHWAHDYGRAHGASMVQLTSDKSRTAAHRFYRALGYTDSHEGFKLEL